MKRWLTALGYALGGVVGLVLVAGPIHHEREVEIRASASRFNAAKDVSQWAVRGDADERHARECQERPCWFPLAGTRRG